MVGGGVETGLGFTGEKACKSLIGLGRGITSESDESLSLGGITV